MSASTERFVSCAAGFATGASASSSAMSSQTFSVTRYPLSSMKVFSVSFFFVFLFVVVPRFAARKLSIAPVETSTGSAISAISTSLSRSSSSTSCSFSDAFVFGFAGSASASEVLCSISLEACATTFFDATGGFVGPSSSSQTASSSLSSSMCFRFTFFGTGSFGVCPKGPLEFLLFFGAALVATVESAFVDFALEKNEAALDTGFKFAVDSLDVEMVGNEVEEESEEEEEEERAGAAMFWPSGSTVTSAQRIDDPRLL
eukprot:CAMPEP_0171643780 /NCGR_PEP_ID=MMETSP0990-20121206/32943_1 /TAXON_ID=483369 /ORGANISM="non described non described, Strain CCMP2098" /LENGTH=258 /DNA_ID=CAMNT_0012219635 /DNA_START=218 /DNA_END=997 /DNA_ORIENTATION=-